MRNISDRSKNVQRMLGENKFDMLLVKNVWPFWTEQSYEDSGRKWGKRDKLSPDYLRPYICQSNWFKFFSRYPGEPTDDVKQKSNEILFMF